MTEQARARSLLEVLSSAQLDTEKLVPDSLRLERETLRMQVAATEQRRTELLDKSGNGTDSTDLFDLEVEIDRLMTELAEVEQKMRAASPAYAELTSPEVATVDEVEHSLLDPDTALLDFRLGEARSFLFLITPDAFQTFELPARGVLEEDARCIHWLLTSFTNSDTGTDGDETRATCLGPGRAALDEGPSQNPFETRARHRRLVEQAFAERASMLSDHLFREAFDSGLLDGRRLAVITDGALEYVPFAALPEPGTTRPLVMHHELAMLPSASVLAFQRHEDRPEADPHHTLAVIADPLYGRRDERIARASDPSEGLRDGSEGTHYARLPYSLGGSDLDRGPRAAGPDAGRARLRRHQGSGARIRPGGVSRRAFRRPRRHRRRLPGAVTAGTLPGGCGGATSRGRVVAPPRHLRHAARRANGGAVGVRHRPRPGDPGRGLGGARPGFMYAGARRVVASLWRVQDRATATLMERFYRGLLEGHLEPADALRQAQLAMISEDGGQYAFPYYWAGFVLQGDWR